MPTEINGEMFYTTQEIADIHGVDRTNAIRQCRLGTIKAVRFGKSWLIPDSELSSIKFNHNRTPCGVRKISSDSWAEFAAKFDKTQTYTAYQISKLSGVKPPTIYNYLTNGSLKGIKDDVSDTWKISGNDALVFFKKKYKIEAAD